MKIQEIVDALRKEMLPTERQLRGKTIDTAELKEQDETLVLTFTDGTSFVLHAGMIAHGEYTTQEIITDLNAEYARIYGLLSDEEWAEAQANDKELRQAEEEKRERSELSRLKVKYES